MATGGCVWKEPISRYKKKDFVIVIHAKRTRGILKAI
jgi:hypothetical protein